MGDMTETNDAIAWLWRLVKTADRAELERMATHLPRKRREVITHCYGDRFALKSVGHLLAAVDESPLLGKPQYARIRVNLVKCLEDCRVQLTPL
jgi:hypothetical protein